MIDIRYHIYSLAAVFFALAVGIVVGTSFADRSPSADSARRTVQRYEALIPDLKEEIEAATEQKAQQQELARESEEFCRAVMPIVLKDRLQWRNVSIIQIGDYDNMSGTVKRALELASASVNSITIVNPRFSLDNRGEVAQAIRTIGAEPPPDANQARDRLISLICDAACSPSDTQILSKAERAGVARFTGDYLRVNRLVVLVGGSKTQRSKILEDSTAQLVAMLEKRGAVVVGCEGTRAKCSYVPAWSKMGIATVDNVDTAMGQVSLVCALNGEKAQFGTKPTAERMVPRTLETE